MERFVKGDIIVTPFPFSNLSFAKKRPALVIAALDGDDIIVCQITSKTVSDRYSIRLVDNDFVTGGLKKESNIRPNRLFTADSSIILYRAGVISKKKMKEVVEMIIAIITKE